jgi:hypothetical protein
MEGLRTMRFNVHPARVLSVLMLIAVVNVYVFAGGVTSSSTAVLGRLITTSNRPVLVNGGEAITGTVVLSGSQLLTSAASVATVQLPNIGTVTIAPSSSVGLSFDAKTVTARVAYGDATITTADGVVGSVVDAAGKPKAPGSTPGAPANSSAKNWGIAGVAIGGGAFIWAIIAWNKAGNADDDAKAAQAQAAALAAQLAALRTCLAGQTSSPVKLCTSF